LDHFKDYLAFYFKEVVKMNCLLTVYIVVGQNFWNVKINRMRGKFFWMLTYVALGWGGFVFTN